MKCALKRFFFLTDSAIWWLQKVKTVVREASFGHHWLTEVALATL